MQNNNLNRHILITGAAGFIGAALSQRLLNIGENILGIDNLNSYYSTSLKRDRLKQIENNYDPKISSWKFFKCDLIDQTAISEIFKEYRPSIVINLAAQAGVRYSLENPYSYIQSNIVGFTNLIELCKTYSVGNFIFASSSSVYGGNRNLPYFENQSVDHPKSLYAATKKTNELIAHCYSSLYDIPCTGLRFFTVYGPWGRPDMAPMIFANSIIKKKPINIFNFGNMQRDFTYIDDVVEGIVRCCSKPANTNVKFDPLNPENASSFAPYRIFNIGNNQPIKLLKFIEILEETIGIKAIKNFLPMQLGDVKETFANTDLLNEWVGFKPSTKIEDGIKNFAEWYKNYYP